jgi:hypothetical protein
MTQAQIDANQELEELKQIWLDQANEDSDKITALIAAYEQSPPDHPQFPDEIYRLFHDMQGQGGLFGYSLLATLGGRLCAYWRGIKGVIGPQELPVMKAFLVALRFILDRKLEGNGGQAGQAILAKLDALTQQSGA